MSAADRFIFRADEDRKFDQAEETDIENSAPAGTMAEGGPMPKSDHSQFALLKTKRFLPLFLTQFLGAFNDNVFKNALVILITYKAAGKVGMDPRLLVTAAAGIFILPFFLFSATAGQLADKISKAAMIRAVKLIEIAIMACASLGFFLENYEMLLFVLFLCGTHSTFFGPLKYSILPEQLKESELAGGNALIEAGTFLAILLGTILGGVAILHDRGVGLISAALMIVAGLGWLSSRSIPDTGSRTPGVAVDYNFLGATWRLVRSAAKNKDVFLSIIGISWFWLVGATFLAQFPVYVSTVLAANSNVVTLFLTVFSVGIALGSVICGRLMKGEVTGKPVPLGAAGMTAAMLLFWYFSPAAQPGIGDGALAGISTVLSLPRNWPILAGLLGTAVFGGIYIVPLYTLMQARSGAEERSRIVAVNNVMNALFMVLGSVLAMLLLQLNFSINDIFLAIGLVNVPVALLVRRVVRDRRAERNKE